MGNHISFVRGIRGAVATLPFLLAACAIAPLQEPIPYVEAEPVADVSDDAPHTTAFEQDLDDEALPSVTRITEGVNGVRIRTEAPLRYVVKRGDTLWDIAGYYLRDPWQWPELWYANPQVENPHLIYPGDELFLVWVEGMPRVARRPDVPLAQERERPPLVTPPAGIEKRSPEVREQPLDEAIYTIPIEAIRAFLRGPRVIDRSVLKDAPYVLDFQEDQLIAGADSTAYVLNLRNRAITRYQIIRLGREYRDPDNNDLIGHEAIPVAETEVRAYGDPSTVYITRSVIETRVGDHLLPLDDVQMAARFQPRAPARRVDGRIISVYDGASKIGQFQVVALNRGTRHGLEPGHVLSIYQTGRTAKDPKSWFSRQVQLPDVYAGTVMVFKTDTRLSYALVMNAVRPIHVLDRAERPAPSS
jgi:LysM repeat protein